MYRHSCQKQSFFDFVCFINFPPLTPYICIFRFEIIYLYVFTFSFYFVFENIYTQKLTKREVWYCAKEFVMWFKMSRHVFLSIFFIFHKNRLKGFLLNISLFFWGVKIIIILCLKMYKFKRFFFISCVYNYLRFIEILYKAFYNDVHPMSLHNAHTRAAFTLDQSSIINNFWILKLFLFSFILLCFKRFSLINLRFGNRDRAFMVNS